MYPVSILSGFDDKANSLMIWSLPKLSPQHSLLFYALNYLEWFGFFYSTGVQRVERRIENFFCYAKIVCVTFFEFLLLSKLCVLHYLSFFFLLSKF